MSNDTTKINPRDIIKTILDTQEIAPEAAEMVLTKVCESREMFDHVMTVFSEDETVRKVILRACLEIARRLPSFGFRGAGAPETKEEATILELFPTDGSMVTLGQMKARAEEKKMAAADFELAWKALVSSGHIEKIGHGRGTAYKRSRP